MFISFLLMVSFLHVQNERLKNKLAGLNFLDKVVIVSVDISEHNGSSKLSYNIFEVCLILTY